MKKEKLIEELSKLPDGVEISIFDWQKNLNNGEDTNIGMYPKFDIELHTLEPDELESFKDQFDVDFKPFATLNIENDDYDNEGKFIKEIE